MCLSLIIHAVYLEIFTFFNRLNGSVHKTNDSFFRHWSICYAEFVHFYLFLIICIFINLCFHSKHWIVFSCCLYLQFGVQKLDWIGIIIKTIVVRLINGHGLQSCFLFHNGWRDAIIFDGLPDVIFLFIQSDVDILKFIGNFRWFSSIDVGNLLFMKKLFMVIAHPHFQHLFIKCLIYFIFSYSNHLSIVLFFILQHFIHWSICFEFVPPIWIKLSILFRFNRSSLRFWNILKSSW